MKAKKHNATKPRAITPSGIFVCRETGAEAPLDARTVRLVMQGWNLKLKIDELQAQLGKLNGELLEKFGDDCSLVLPSLCRAQLSARETVKITDADKLRGVLRGGFVDLVRETAQYKPEPKLVAMACDADEPLAPMIRACLAASKSFSVTWRAEK